MTSPSPLDPLAGWGVKSEQLRAKAGKLHALITGYGIPYLVRRIGQPDVRVIAYLWQSKPAASAKAEDPAFNLLGSEGLFLPDAPVLERGFILIREHDGRIFTPDNDVQDIADQGVALWGHFTPYLEHTRAYALTFSSLTGRFIEDPDNIRPVQERVDLPPITVRLAATVDPKLIELAGGGDEATLTFVGRWGSLAAPIATKPNALRWGDYAPLEVDGQTGTLTLAVAYPDPELGTAQHFGGRFVARWQATPSI